MLRHLEVVGKAPGLRWLVGERGFWSEKPVVEAGVALPVSGIAHALSKCIAYDGQLVAHQEVAF